MNGVVQVEQPETCVVMDLGDSVILTLPRAAGRIRRRIDAPISRVLRVMRTMGWRVVETRRDDGGLLRVYLDRYAADESEPQTVSQRRILIGA